MLKITINGRGDEQQQQQPGTASGRLFQIPRAVLKAGGSQEPESGTRPQGAHLLLMFAEWEATVFGTLFTLTPVACLFFFFLPVLPSGD